jgi:putative transcriptional regulator
MANEPAEVSQKCLLISMPSLLDPFFFHTTSLITEFNKNGAMGIVLNRPLNMNLSQVLEPENKTQNTDHIRVYWGGPVQNERGWILHEDESLATDSMTIAPGVYLSNSLAALTRMIQTKPDETFPKYRFFLGYAGWNPGQLEKEMASSSWVTAPVDPSLLFDVAPETLWQRALDTIGVDPSKLVSADAASLN